MMKKHLLVALICFFTVLSLCTAHAENAINKDPAIFWDEAGNVHFFTNTESELHFAWGWAQMRDNTKLLLNSIQEGRLTSTTTVSDSNYQFFADGMTGFLNRRLDTLSPAHRALLPLKATDVLALKMSEQGEWRSVFLHQSEFLGAGISSLGYPQIAVDSSVEAVDRAILMEDFRMLELLLPLSQNE